MDSLSYLLGLMTIPCIVGAVVILNHFNINPKQEFTKLFKNKDKK